MKQLSFRVQDVLLAGLISLFVGWLAALVFALWIAALQYSDVAANLPSSQVSAAFELRLDHELRHGLLVFLPQVGIATMVLAWQVARHANRANDPRMYGAAAGIFVALVQSIIAVILQVAWIYVVLLWLLFVGVGSFAGWFADPQQRVNAK